MTRTGIAVRLVIMLAIVGAAFAIRFATAPKTFAHVSTSIYAERMVSGAERLEQSPSIPGLPFSCAGRCIANTRCSGFTESAPGVNNVPFGICTIYSGETHTEPKPGFTGGEIERSAP